MKENEMGRVYSIYRRDEKYIQNLVRKPERKRTLETPV
jgi:hypothetical protein